jgi:hypothetical protein
MKKNGTIPFSRLTIAQHTIFVNIEAHNFFARRREMWYTLARM